jgi:hypothetical protein
MAAWDSASINANVSSPGILRSRLEVLRALASRVEPEVRDKWHPAAKLALIVGSGGLLWAGIIAVIAVVFF